MDNKLILDFIDKKKFEIEIKEYSSKKIEVISVQELIGFIKLMKYFVKVGE